LFTLSPADFRAAEAELHAYNGKTAEKPKIGFSAA
jgi:hypothetical protein